MRSKLRKILLEYGKECAETYYTTDINVRAKEYMNRIIKLLDSET